MTSRLENYLHNNKKRQKERRDSKLFAALVAAPQALTGGAAPTVSGALTLPAGARVGVSYSVGITAGQLLVNTSKGGSVGTQNLSANQIYQIGWFGKSIQLEIEVTVALAGTATLYRYNGFGVPEAIANSVFT